LSVRAEGRLEHQEQAGNEAKSDPHAHGSINHHAFVLMARLSRRGVVINAQITDRAGSLTRGGSEIVPEKPTSDAARTTLSRVAFLFMTTPHLDTLLSAYYMKRSGSGEGYSVSRTPAAHARGTAARAAGRVAGDPGPAGRSGARLQMGPGGRPRAARAASRVDELRPCADMRAPAGS